MVRVLGLGFIHARAGRKRIVRERERERRERELNESLPYISARPLHASTA
jgi:hypothetical protein